MLFLFLIKRDAKHDNEPEWDATHGFVIAAMNEVEARIIASQHKDTQSYNDQSSDIWYASTTSCTRIGVAADNITAVVILRDHHSG